MHQSELQDTIQYNTFAPSQGPAAGLDHVTQPAQALDSNLKTFLYEVANNSIKVDMLCYFTRLATTGYYKLDSNWKSVHPTGNRESPTQPQAKWLQGLPATGYHAASFPSTQELADILSCSAHNVNQAALELHSCGALTYCASFGDADVCYMDVKRHSPFISAALIALLQAAYYNPDALKRYLEELETNA